MAQYVPERTLPYVKVTLNTQAERALYALKLIQAKVSPLVLE
jgi:hypothetical protein